MKPKTLSLLFFDYLTLPKSPGMKYVLFRIEDLTGKFIGFDWGMGNFENGKFEELVEGERRAWVVKWAEMPNPQLIL